MANSEANKQVNNPEIVLEMKGMTKKFGDFVANHNIDFELYRGEVHSILGENGAGKSTLMNVLYGMIKPTSGTIIVNGKPLISRSPSDAIKTGIGMVHQHFMLIPPFTVLENIVLGNEPVKSAGQIDFGKARKEVANISETYGLHVDLDSKVRDITVGMQQRVEIIKALYRGADILILDEPTAVLTPQEIVELAHILKNLCNEGKSIIIITHKLNEIKEMADRCTIIRRGVKIGTVDVDAVSENQLASMMVGREVNMIVEKEPAHPGEAVLSIENLFVNNSQKLPAVRGLNLELRKGEILGIAGIDGNGQTELIEAITGLSKPESGKIVLKGEDLTYGKPRKMIDSGLGHIPEDRQRRGLVLEFSIEDNMVFESISIPPYSKNGILNRPEISTHADILIEKYDVRPPVRTNLAKSLSGGNQQKVIIAREVERNPDVLIAAQPTRGLDVGAIEYVHKALVAQRDMGRAVLLISFELDEVMNVSDRIAVIFEGKIVDIIDAKDADENTIGLLMAGGAV